VGQLPQLAVGRLGALKRLGDERPTAFVVGLERAQCELECEDGMDEALLRAVVQVADHAASGIVAGREQALA
jgi:hypothetical protein